jgi:hypothetical protein
MLEKDGNDRQKRFDSFELHQNLHQSHASHAITQPLPATPSYSVLPKKSKGIQKILRDDSVDDELENTKETTQHSSIPMAILQSESSSHEVKNIDDVFVRITDLYTQELYNIIYNSLIIMTKNDTSFNIYIDGLNKILEPTNNTIKKWIDENIVF